MKHSKGILPGSPVDLWDKLLIYSIKKHNYKLMKKVLANQKRVSAIVALALATVITFMAVINSYGVPANDEFIFEFDENALMERVLADMVTEKFATEEEAPRTIKIYNENDELIEAVTLVAGEQVENSETRKLLNRAEYLSGYGNTSIYKVSL